MSSPTRASSTTETCSPELVRARAVPTPVPTWAPKSGAEQGCSIPGAPIPGLAQPCGSWLQRALCGAALVRSPDPAGAVPERRTKVRGSAAAVAPPQPRLGARGAGASTTNVPLLDLSPLDGNLAGAEALRSAASLGALGSQQRFNTHSCGFRKAWVCEVLGPSASQPRAHTLRQLPFPGKWWNTERRGQSNLVPG
jgi:hypothetical protein